MTKSLYVIGNSTLINSQFSFTIFNTYYPDKQSALNRAKSEAEASLNNYLKKYIAPSIIKSPALPGFFILWI